MTAQATMRTVGISVGMLVFLSALSGCGFISFTRLSVNDLIRPDDVTFIVTGKTTFAEVIEKLGVPDELTSLDEGVMTAYHFRDAKYLRVNYGWALRYWSPVTPDLVLGGGGLGTDMFLIVLDPDWVVRQHAFAHHVQASRYKPWPF